MKNMMKCTVNLEIELDLNESSCFFIKRYFRIMSKDYSLTVQKLFEIIIPQKNQYPLGTGHKLNVLETFRKRLYVQSMCCVQGEVFSKFEQIYSGCIQIFTEKIFRENLQFVCSADYQMITWITWFYSFGLWISSKWRHFAFKKEKK